MEHDETGRCSAQHHLDVRSRLHGGRLGSRRCGAGHRDQERRFSTRLVAGVPRPASVVCGTAPVRLRVAEPEGRTRDPVGAGPEPGAPQARRRAGSDSRGVRWNTGTDPCGQPYSYLRIDHGRDADREPGPPAFAIAEMSDCYGEASPRSRPMRNADATATQGVRRKTRASEAKRATRRSAPTKRRARARTLGELRRGLAEALRAKADVGSSRGEAPR